MAIDYWVGVAQDEAVVRGIGRRFMRELGPLDDSYAEVTPAQFGMQFIYARMTFAALDNHHFQYNAGFYDEVTWQSFRAQLQSFVSTNRMASLLLRRSSGFFRNDFRALCMEILQQGEAIEPNPAASRSSEMQPDTPEHLMPQPVVFFDIAGPDDTVLKAFYAALFDWEQAESGNYSIPVHSPIEATIRQDPAEKRIYIGVPDVSQSLEQIVEQGGSVDVPRFEVPGVVVLGLFRDPAGNPMGLVEMDGDRHRVP